MKVQLVYDRPAETSADILLVVLDEGYKLHDVSGSAIEEVKAAFRTAEKIRKSLKEEMAKKINARTAALVEPVDDGADEDFDNSQPATSKQWFSTGRVRY